MLRTTLLITILVIVVLMVLSEIGVNIAPLLAGAGIVGVAIGFGSQKLVQDLITGMFLLLENAMQVGDQVTVSGLSGMVENLSVRTIRLRAADGSVHIIPFSAVTSVTNTNRGIGNAAVEVSGGLRRGHRPGQRRAEGDRGRDAQGGAVQEHDAERSAALGRGQGRCHLGTLAGQIVCTDSGRWPVQREFNRRDEAPLPGAGDRDPDPDTGADHPNRGTQRSPPAMPAPQHGSMAGMSAN